MTEEEKNLLLSLLERDMVLYAPKSNRGLKMEYPDLAEYEEFNDLNEPELRFVWCWSCVSSPFVDLPEKDGEKLKLCLEYAYPEELTRKTKFIQFNGSGLPDEIRRACVRMEVFNLSARAEEMVYLLKLRENCKYAIAQDIRSMDDKQQDLYWSNAQKARKELIETRHAVERGGLGLSEGKETQIHLMKNLIGMYHKNQR